MRRALREAGLWFAARRAAGRSSGPSGRGAVPVPAREPRRHQATGGAACWRASCQPLARGAGVPARARRPRASTGRPSGSRTSPSTRRANGLAYVGDARPHDLLPERRAGGGRGRAGRRSRAATGSRREQLIDILRCVFFRQSVLCRDSRTAGRRAGPRRVLRRPALRGARRRAGRRAAGRAARLGARAAALARARTRCPSPSCGRRRAPTPTSSREALRDGFLAELVMPHRSPLRDPRSAEGVERPVASPLARWQARASGRGHEPRLHDRAHGGAGGAPAAAPCSTARATAPRSGPSSASAPGCRYRPRTSTTNLEALGRLFLLVGPVRGLTAQKMPCSRTCGSSSVSKSSTSRPR